VYLNSAAGTIERFLAVLDGDSRFELHCLPPQQMAAAIDREIEQRSDRVLVCGGDGTLALAAARLAGTKTALAALPGGTLNNSAARLGVPTGAKAALELALSGQPRPVAAGYVNNRLFLNTSSVGAYVFFVRTRNNFEQKMDYHTASLLAGLRRLARFRSVKLIVKGNVLRSPLVFIGVNERELRFPKLGQQKPNGDEGLHIIAVKSSGRLEAFKIVCKAIFRGIDPLENAHEAENLLQENLKLSYHRHKREITIRLDGELVSLKTPLKYRFAPAALSVIMPGPPEAD
jgi:diacylglycerol kinase family enzyme